MEDLIRSMEFVEMDCCVPTVTGNNTILYDELEVRFLFSSGAMGALLSHSHAGMMLTACYEFECITNS